MSSILNCTGHKLALPSITEADGVYLIDQSGKKFLDLESGVWCTPLGHKNKQINKAIERQIQSVTHVGFCYSHNIVEKAGKAVLEITKLQEGKCVFLCSGSEAIELARQASKFITGKSTTLCLHDAYLGSFSSTQSRDHGWSIFDWTDCANCPKSDTCDVHCPKFDDIPDTIAEFIFEPGSSCGFVRFPPQALIKNIVEIVRQKKGKIIVNDVTTGMGRTGKWFGYNHYPIDPDFVAIGKGLGNGYPVSALAIKTDTANQLEDSNFKYMQSHQNDPLGAAVANEVIKQITNNKLIARASALGEKLLSSLQTLLDSPHIIEIRGRGMMFAVDLSCPEIGDKVYEQLLDSGFIVCNRSGTFRIDPPLIIEEEDFQNFINSFKSILDDL